MSRNVAVAKFNENLTRLFHIIENLFRYQTIEPNIWMELYTIAYDSCTSSSKVEWILYATANGRQKYLLSVGIDRYHDRYCGGELYYNLEKYLLNYVKNLHEMSKNMLDEDFFRFYIDQWNKYQSAIKILHCSLLYLHQHWIRLIRTRDVTSIYDTFTLSLLIWFEFFLMPNVERLTSICFNMIDNDRKTHIITNTDLIKSLVDSYMMFDFDNDMPVWFHEQQTTISAVNVYKQYFEIPFVENTKRFYQIEADKYVNESLLVYLTKVARYIDDEEHRVHSYLRLSSIESFLIMIEEILIRNYLNDICNQVKNMLNKQNYHDLKCIFEPIRRMSITKTKLKPIIEDYIYQKGYQSIEQISDTTIQDPHIFIKTIVEIYEKFSELIQDIFLNDPIFIDAFNQACGKFINRNTMTDTGKTSSQLLAEYCNKLLRNNNRVIQEDEFEKHLNDIMIVFNYIEDKDAFESFYRKFLSKRLINKLSISYDYEQMIISKLKQTCSRTYTSKLERILTDIHLSEDMIDKYQTHYQKKQIIQTFQFSAMILSSNLWTLSSSDEIILPEKLQFVLNHFTDFYKSHHNGRKLTFVVQHSTGELEMIFTKPKYILQVSTYQMMILLLFNESTQWTIEQIQDKIHLKTQVLLDNLHHLFQLKILTYDEQTAMNINSMIHITDRFQNKRIRINVNIPIKSIEQKEIENVYQTIDEDRKLLIQTTIIRIMKTRQALKYALLIQEVIQQLSSRFKPKIPLIKKCIDILIEKEYLERDSNDKDILRYLA